MNITPLTISGRSAVIPLTRGKFAVVDVADWPLVAPYCWFVITSDGGNLYARRKENGRPVWMHREIAGAPAGTLVDHCDGNGLNNRRLNLRCATRQQNGANRKSSVGRATPKGIYYLKKENKWQAHIRVNYRKIHLGTFTTVEEAIRAYDAAAAQHQGEFALTKSREVSH